MEVSSEELEQIWGKAEIADSIPGAIARKDACGAWILRSAFRKPEHPFGWDIDHICPESFLKEKDIAQSDIDNILNLRPLHVSNLKSKGNDYPAYHYTMISSGDFNIEASGEMKVREELQIELKNFYNL